MAAALLGAVAYALVPRPSSLRGNAARSGAAQAIESRVTDLDLPRDRFVLRWTPAVSGAVYSVSIRGEGNRTLQEARDLREPEYTVPATALSDVPPSGRILWRVDAVLPDGTTIGSSEFTAVVR